MIFTQTRVKGAYIVDVERRVDRRGFFARAWCQNEFAAQGLASRLAQINISHNARRGTLRGVHFQEDPHQEVKIVSCTQGVIYDVVLDLRQDSPSYLAWDAIELSDTNQRMLYVPKGCAHGFQTLADDTQVLYLMSEFYVPGYARGVRYDDGAIAIAWPLPVTCISEADLMWPDYSPQHGVQDAEVQA